MTRPSFKEQSLDCGLRLSCVEWRRELKLVWNRVLFSVIGLLVIPILLTGEQRPTYRKANKDSIHAYVMLIRLRADLYTKWKSTGKWPDDKEANSALTEHGRYWHEQLENGRAILAGGMDGDYWDNVALIIFEANSQAEAEALVAADPAVKAYVFQAQVRPFNVSFITNKFDTQEPARDSSK
jgi:uncharacterized protein YciI